jgi:hypothetical protein
VVAPTSIFPYGLQAMIAGPAMTDQRMLAIGLAAEALLRTA